MERGFYYRARATEGRTKARRCTSTALLSLLTEVTEEPNSFPYPGFKYPWLPKSGTNIKATEVLSLMFFHKPFTICVK